MRISVYGNFVQSAVVGTWFPICWTLACLAERTKTGFVGNVCGIVIGGDYFMVCLFGWLVGFFLRVSRRWQLTSAEENLQQWLQVTSVMFHDMLYVSNTPPTLSPSLVVVFSIVFLSGVIKGGHLWKWSLCKSKNVLNGRCCCEYFSEWVSEWVCVCVCVCVCAHACVRACVRACVCVFIYDLLMHASYTVHTQKNPFLFKSAEIWFWR